MPQHDPEMDEYLALKRRAQGKKPPAAGRTWRRVAATVIPPAVREPLQQTFGETTGDVIGLCLTPIVGLIPLGMGFMCLKIVPQMMRALLADNTLAGPDMTGPLLSLMTATEPFATGVLTIGVFVMGIRMIWR